MISRMPIYVYSRLWCFVLLRHTAFLVVLDGTYDFYLVRKFISAFCSFLVLFVLFARAAKNYGQVDTLLWHLVQIWSPRPVIHKTCSLRVSPAVVRGTVFSFTEGSMRRRRDSLYINAKIWTGLACGTSWIVAVLGGYDLGSSFGCKPACLECTR